MVAQVFGDNLRLNLVVCRQSSHLLEFLAVSEEFDQGPDSVLLSGGVDELLVAELVDKEACQSTHVDQVFVFTEDVLVMAKGFLFFRLSRGKLPVELLVGFARVKVLVELEEDHDLVHIELVVDVVVQRRAELVKFPRTDINSVPLAVVNEVGNAVEVVVLKATSVVQLEVASVHRAQMLSLVLRQLVQERVS